MTFDINFWSDEDQPNEGVYTTFFNVRITSDDFLPVEMK